MTDKEIAIKIAEHTKDIRSLEHRVDDAEKEIKVFNKIVTSVEKLAVNMQYMADEQKEQGIRLERLEKEPLENIKYSKRALITGILSAIGSAIVGAAITYLCTFGVH